MTKTLYILLSFAVAALAYIATTTVATSDPGKSFNLLTGKTIVIPSLSDANGGTALFYENCRIEVIGDRTFLVAEKIVVDGEREKDRFHVPTGVVDYIPWDRVSGFSVFPPEVLAYELGERKIPPK